MAEKEQQLLCPAKLNYVHLSSFKEKDVIFQKQDLICIQSLWISLLFLHGSPVSLSLLRLSLVWAERLQTRRGLLLVIYIQRMAGLKALYTLMHLRSFSFWQGRLPNSNFKVCSHSKNLSSIEDTDTDVTWSHTKLYVKGSVGGQV